MSAEKFEVSLDTVNVNDPEFVNYLQANKIRVAEVQAGEGGGRRDRHCLTTVVTGKYRTVTAQL